MKRLLLGAFAVLFGISCGGSDDDNPLSSDSLAGSYNLVSLTVSGGTAVQPPDASGILALTENQYQVTATFLIAGTSNVTTVTQSGGYTRSGDSLTLTPDGGGGAQSGTVANEGRSITISIAATVSGQAQTISMSFTKAE